MQAQPFTVTTDRAEPVRFVVIRSLGSQFNVYDRKREAVAAQGQRFGRDAAQAKADDLNGISDLAARIPNTPLPDLRSAFALRSDLVGAFGG